MLGSISPRLAALLPQTLKVGELRVRTRNRAEQKDEPGSTPEALKAVLSQLGKLRASLERLEKTGRSAKTLAGPGDPAQATSTTALALVREPPGLATLRSTEEVNTATTSYSPVLPTFDGPQSTAQPVIGGVYDGDQGDHQLKFRVRDNRNIGDAGRIRINIRDEANKTIQNLDFDSLPANTELTLNNGLTLQFDAGYLKKNENFYVDVSTSVGTDVDPTKAFNGTRDQDPKFEPGLSVTAGSFDVNGVTINVAADDSINSVVAKITASAADVTASYDAATDSVVLTENTVGAGLVVGNDTSGFLAATKLAGATPTGSAQFASAESGEEVNTTPTSYSPILPTYDGPQSTAQPVIGGVYDGDQGDQQLKFRVRDNRNIGDAGRIRINIRDEANVTIQNLDFDSLPANTELTLNNGLTLQFDAGYLKKNENFYVDVSTSVGTDVDPTKAFNGTRDQDPQFESGLSVTAGSFDVSGVTINVAADDTINSVVGKINGSGAGVTASFDVAREKVVVTQQTAGSFKSVVLDNDTSGFLAATKLDAPTTIAGGQGHDSDRLINTVADLSEAGTGNFEINGVSINVDVGTDSLSDVVARINSSGAGVTASYTESSNVVTIVSQSKTADLVLDNGTSNFFSALNITAGTYKAPPEDGAGGRILENPDLFELELEKFGSELDEIFKNGFKGLDDEELRPAIEQALTGTISDSFSKILGDTSEDKLRSRFGIDFDFREAQNGIFGYNGSQLADTLEEDLEQLTDFLFREDSKGKKEGLVVSLIETVRELEDMFRDALRPTSGELKGLVVDLSV